MVEWSFININTHIHTWSFKNLTIILALQNGIRLLEQWNNKIWVLLHKIVDYLLTFQTYSTNISTFGPSSFANMHHSKSLIFHNKEIKISTRLKKTLKKISSSSSLFFSFPFSLVFSFLPSLKKKNDDDNKLQVVVVACSWRPHELFIIIKRLKNATYMEDCWNLEEGWRWQKRGDQGSLAAPKHQKHIDKLYYKTNK